MNRLISSAALFFSLTPGGNCNAFFRHGRSPCCWFPERLLQKNFLCDTLIDKTNHPKLTTAPL
jgi:hypothetical protein